jgi:hypothetical protein
LEGTRSKKSKSKLTYGTSRKDLGTVFSRKKASRTSQDQVEEKQQATSIYVHTYLLEKGSESAVLGQSGEKYFDYFVFNIVDCGSAMLGGSTSPRPCDFVDISNTAIQQHSGARRCTFTQTIGNARGLDINSPLSAEAHTQDL